MPEDASRQTQDPSRERRTERQAPSPFPGLEGLAPLDAPIAISPSGLLGDPRLNGRGNGPVKVALMRQAQQVYGNRAVQRFLHQRRHSIPPSHSLTVQRHTDPVGGTASVAHDPVLSSTIDLEP